MVVSALMKLAGGAPTLASELNVDAFLRQARSYDEASAGPLGWYLRHAAAHSTANAVGSSANFWRLILRAGCFVVDQGIYVVTCVCVQECTNTRLVPSFASHAGS